MQKKWDIFCQIVDNYGDIGFCWRLAKQLLHEHNVTVRLWVDDWSVAQKIIPSLKNHENHIILEEGVEVLKWHHATIFESAADIVVETFSCGLPSSYMSLMSQQQSIWINLEYLSAESWVDDFHGKPSPQQGTTLTRYFYFPGFTQKSGGLLREVNQFPSNATHQFNLQSDALNISLFAYPHADIAALIHLLVHHNKPVHCYVPESILLPKIAQCLHLDCLKVGDYLIHGQLHLHVLPFLTQDEYDALLAKCDLNFVRGEDSWVRAIWASKPFIWQPYLQEDKAHIKKLDAFLNTYYAHADGSIKYILLSFHHAWIEGGLNQIIWQQYINALLLIKQITSQATLSIKQQPDLAAKLVIFCNKFH